MEFVEQTVEIEYSCKVTITTKKLDCHGNVVSENLDERDASRTKKFYPQTLIVPGKTKLKVRNKMSAETVTIPQARARTENIDLALQN